MANEAVQSKPKIKVKSKPSKRDFLDLLLLMVCIPILVVGIIVTFSMTQSKKKGDVPTFFGYSFLEIVSGSMYPDFKVGDTIVVKHCTMEEIEVGDVISFHRGSKVVTHKVNRILFVTVDGERVMAFETYGINNVDEYGNIIMDTSFVIEQNMVGKFYQMGGPAAFVKFLSGSWGLVLFVILPLGAIIISDILSLFGITKEIKDEKFDVYYKYKRSLNLIDKYVDDYAIVKQVSSDGHVQYLLAPAVKQEDDKPNPPPTHNPVHDDI